MHLEAFPLIETLLSHIFFDFNLSDFWYAFNDYQILFPKYGFFDKKWNFYIIIANEYEYH